MIACILLLVLDGLTGVVAVLLLFLEGLFVIVVVAPRSAVTQRNLRGEGRCDYQCAVAPDQPCVDCLVAQLLAFVWVVSYTPCCQHGMWGVSCWWVDVVMDMFLAAC